MIMIIVIFLPSEVYANNLLMYIFVGPVVSIIALLLLGQFCLGHTHTVTDGWTGGVGWG